MPGLIQVFVVVALFRPVRFWRDHDVDARFFQQVQNPFLRVIGFIRQKGLNAAKDVGEQDVRSIPIAGLPGREMKAGGIAQGIAAGVDFRGQSPLAAADAFRFPIPPVASALC